MMNAKITKNITIAAIIMVVTCLPKYAFASGSLKRIEEFDEMERENSLKTITRPTLRYEAAGLRDPFQQNIIEGQEGAPNDTPQQQASLPSNFVIQGIIWGGKIPQAIINNKVVKVGDILDEAKIIDISKNGVVVFYNNRNFELSSPAADNLKSIANNSEGGKNEVNF